MGLRPRWIAVALPLALALVGGCGSSDASSKDAPDAGAAGVTIRTRTPFTEFTTGAWTNATWAAWLDGTGKWVALPAPTVPGTYVIQPPPGAATWTVAFACADDDRSLVAVVQRQSSVRTLDVELEQQCAPNDKDAFDLTGTFAHIPLTTTWLDFGYALDDRGSVMPADGENAPYTLANIFQGTWDFGFGLRDQGGGTLTKIMLVRNQAISAATNLDIDVAAMGVDPIAKPLIVNGIGLDENFSVTGQYALGGGLHGLDIGPQDVPSRVASVTLAYMSVPPGAAVPGDRHRLRALGADADKERATTARVVETSFQAAVDVTMELPAGVDPPRATVIATDPYVRLDTFVKTRPGTASYQVVALARISNRQMHAWRMSVDAVDPNAPEAQLTIPDLSAAAGFDKAWVIPPGLQREITATVTEAPTPLGDGTMTRSASHLMFMEP